MFTPTPFDLKIPTKTQKKKTVSKYLLTKLLISFSLSGADLAVAYFRGEKKNIILVKKKKQQIKNEKTPQYFKGIHPKSLVRSSIYKIIKIFAST